MFVLVVRNNSNPKAMEASYLLSAYLESQSIGCCFVESSELYAGLSPADRGLSGKEVDLAVVLGGDGTILHCARFLQGLSTPILGVNFGNLGFLANSGEDGVLELVARAFAGELHEDRRANLDIAVECDGVREEAEGVGGEGGRCGHGPVGGASEGASEGGAGNVLRCFALNEVAITRGATGRTIQYALDVSDVHMSDVAGDGVIVATATGSTAYSLAAGGPIVHPAYGGLIVQPLAPHTLTARAVLTEPNDVVRIDLSKTREGREASVFLDGDALATPGPVSSVIVRRGTCPTTLLYADGNHFYNYAASTFFGS